MDRDLVEAAQHGDQAAFVNLVRSRGDRLFAIAYRILRDVDRAEDAVQDALVIAWRDLRDLRDPDRFDAWVHRLLTNVCIAQAGRERRMASNLRLLPFDDPPAPDELLGIAERDQLDRGCRRLNASERAILVLRHYVGYEPSEIAALLDLSPETVVPVSTTPIAPCAPPWKRMPAPPLSEGPQHEPALRHRPRAPGLDGRRPLDDA